MTEAVQNGQAGWVETEDMSTRSSRGDGYIRGLLARGVGIDAMALVLLTEPARRPQIVAFRLAKAAWLASGHCSLAIVDGRRPLPLVATAACIAGIRGIHLLSGPGSFRVALMPTGVSLDEDVELSGMLRGKI